MGFVKKHLVEIIFCSAIIIFYLISRLTTLSQFPIFTDEAIYVRWAQIANNDANWRFISLTDGKQPLFIWFMMIMMRFISDPLIAGRLVSVVAGIFTMIGLYFLSYEIFKNRWIGIVSAFLYSIYPFALIYDRMALYDSLVGTFAIWGLYASIYFIHHTNLQSAMLLGIVAGSAVLNKTNGFFTIYLLPSLLLLFDFEKKNRIVRLIRFVLLSFVTIFITYGIYAILRLSPYFYIVEEKNATFIYPLREWIKHPFLQLFSNITALFDWFVRYFGIPFIVLFLFSYTKKDFWKEKVLLTLYFIIPLAGLAVFGRTLYPRYIFLMTLPLLPLVAYSLISLWKQYKSFLPRLIFLVFSLSYSLYVFFMILINFNASPVPSSDKGQYLTAWPSGVGVPDSVTFFKELAEKEQIYIATQGTFGLLPYAYEVYLSNNKNVTIKGFWPIGNELPQEIVDASKKKRTFLVYYQDCPQCPATGKAPETMNLKVIQETERIEPNSYFTVYEVITN